MPSNSETILTQTTHPGDSSLQTITGDKYKGDGYYGRSDGFHTIQINLNGFQGTIKIQATLSVDPQDDDWFDLDLSNGELRIDTTGKIGQLVVKEIVYNDEESETSSKLYNFTGNYVWIRAYVTYTDGTINSIVMNH